MEPEADTKRGQKGSVERPLQESADAAAEWRSPHVMEEAVAAAVRRSLTAAAGRAVEFGACDEEEFGRSVESRLERVELGQRRRGR